MKKEVIGDATLYCGDALKILPELSSVHCICTDPPYKLTSGGKRGEMGGIFAPENYNNNGSIVECELDWSDFMPLLADILPEGQAYIMANNRNMQAMLNSAEEAGFDFHNILVWDKVIATANRYYMKNCEFAGLFYRGNARRLNNCSAKQLIRCPPNKTTTHPTEKPVALMEWWIGNSTHPGEIVLDPFMGTGATGVACRQLGLPFIGIEKDEKYFEIACERIRRAQFVRNILPPVKKSLDQMVSFPFDVITIDCPESGNLT